MIRRAPPALLFFLLALACAAREAAPPVHRPVPPVVRLPPLLSELTLPDPGPTVDPDGEDDGEPFAPGPTLQALARASAATFQALPPPPAGTHPRVCDVRGFAGAVYVSHLAMAIDLDGAQIHRFDPATGRWTMALDWDRGGAPGRTREVGGQGITRLRVIDGRLFATDADAPHYGGFGLSKAPFEDYLFVSDGRGLFPPLGKDDAPPAGTRVLPFSFHAFDVIAYRGALVASGGTVPLDAGPGWHLGGPYPGGVFVGEKDRGELPPRFTVGGAGLGVVRTTFLHRFRGRLYLGIQNNERRARFDLAVLTGDPRAPATPSPVAARVTPDGGWLTRRFASGGGILYWVASGYPRDGRGGVLFASRDGLGFDRVALPPGAGAPQDVAIVGDTVYLLTTEGLYRRGPAGFVRLAAAPPGDPFGVWDTFCSAPLAVAGDALLAGSLRDGRLWRVDSVAPWPVAPPPLDPRASLVDVPGARFLAGDAHGDPGERPHPAEVAAFRLMRTEVTNAQFAAFVRATGHVTDAERKGEGHVWWRHPGVAGYSWKILAGASWRHPYGPGSELAGADDHAVVQVSARDALAFCAHYGLRLPDELEWEWAARGPDGRRYVWGETPPAATPRERRGNVGTLACCAPDPRDGMLRVGAVGRFPGAASPFGLLDLVGNVWEWTRTPSEREPGKWIIRGAGWGNSAWCLRAAYRHANPPDRGLDMVGFRCAGDR